MAILELTGIECKVEPILSKDYPTLARRPKFSVMDKSKIKKALNLEIPYWKESLKECIFRLNSKEGIIAEL